VIAIHEAFNVPLFFRDTPIHDRLRDVDFIYFANGDGGINGFYGIRRNGYATCSFARAIPGYGDPVTKFWGLFEGEPLFAVDARQESQ
jgi:hypothetical protein